MSSAIFPFQELPSDIKTQIFSYLNFEDWIFVLSRVCAEWKKLCVNSTLPKIISGDMYKEDYDYERLNFEKLLKLGQQYNVTGLVSPLQTNIKMILKIARTLPRVTWIETDTTDRHYGRNHKKNKDLDPFPNSITHFNSSLDTKISLADIAKYLPNLTTLYYKNGVKLDELNKIEGRLEKLKVLRVGVQRIVKQPLHKVRRRAQQKIDPSAGLIEYIQAFKKFAPNLEMLYMFYQLPRGQPAAVALDREFNTLEDAARKIGVRLICRDLQQIMNHAFVDDQTGKFFLRCFKQNGLPYHAYSADETTLLSQAILQLNLPVVKKILAKNMTTMQYELTAVCETSRVSFSEYPLVALQMREGKFRTEYLLPEATGPVSSQIVDLLREKGYDINTKLYLRYHKKLVETPVWSELNFSYSSIRRLFENYPLPIQWFVRGRKGLTLAHKLVVSRGTTVFLDLMEQQLTKDQISELMSTKDNEGNTPVHLFSDASVTTIDRLLPHVKNCWTIKNNKGDNPLQYYIKRCKDMSIDIKEPKIRRFLQETPEIEPGVVYSLFETAKAEVLTRVIPLLAQKGANFKESGTLGRAFFLKQTMPLLTALKEIGVDLTETDENGNNILHGLFWPMSDYGRWKVDTEALKFAVKEGVNINQINKDGETPLIKAVNNRVKNLEDAVKTLLELGADPNLHGNDQLTPLLRACQLSKVFDDVIEVLLKGGAKPFSVRTNVGYYSPLLSCVQQGCSAKRVRLLIEYGADVKERDDVGNSLLHAFMSQISNSMKAKKQKILEIFIKYIDINDTNYNGDTPLHNASNLDFVKWALAHGADVNARNKFGDTPIHTRKMRYLWHDEDKDVLKVFVRNPKVDWTIVNMNKVTMLHYLCHYPISLYYFVHEVLPSKTPEEQQKIKEAFATHSEFHENALFEAAHKHFLDAAKICVEHFGISPAWKSHQTALHILAALKSDPTRSHLRVVTYLLDNGADVNAQEYSAGNTPLYFALKVGNIELVKILLERGADPTIKNKSGQSPIDIAPDLLTRYKGTGMKWRMEPRQKPTEDMNEMVKLYEKAEEERRLEDEMSEEDLSGEELINSDNENEDGANYNEIDENDLENEEDYEEDMSSENEDEDQDDNESGNDDEDDDENDEDNEDSDEEPY